MADSEKGKSSQAYYLRDEDTWTKINYSAKAETWMKPLKRGKPTGMIELPVNWCVSLSETGEPALTWRGTGTSTTWNL